MAHSIPSVMLEFQGDARDLGGGGVGGGGVGQPWDFVTALIYLEIPGFLGAPDAGMQVLLDA